MTSIGRTSRGGNGSVMLVLAVVTALFRWVFPWAEQHLPFLNVTVDQGSGASP